MHAVINYGTFITELFRLQFYRHQTYSDGYLIIL